MHSDRKSRALDRVRDATSHASNLVLCQRLGHNISQATWESIAKEISSGVVIELDSCKIFSTILSEGDATDDHGKINIAGFLKALELEVKNTSDSNKEKISHLYHHALHLFNSIGRNTDL